MNARRKFSGFTLVELLISMLIVGLLLTALNSVFGSSLGATNQVQARDEMTSDAQVAQQIIAGRLREAWYVFPTGTVLSPTSSGTTAQNPVTSGYSWTVGTHPFLAMILPPQASGSCATCYVFLAYYPVKRANMSGSGLDKLSPDTLNDESTWALMEYRGNYSAGVVLSKTSAASTAIPNGLTARVLADYIQPTNGTSPYTMFSFTSSTTTPPAVTAVTFNLRSARQIPGRLLQAPPGTGLYTVTIYPRN